LFQFQLCYFLQRLCFGGLGLGLGLEGAGLGLGLDLETIGLGLGLGTLVLTTRLPYLTISVSTVLYVKFRVVNGFG